jgi:3',5'-cyclic AMP phosphodiesterase CpdA
MKINKLQIIILILIISLSMTFCSASQDIEININLDNIAKPAEYSFVVYGDTRTNYLIHEKMVQSIMLREPDMVIHTGDLVANGYSKSQWERFMNIIQPLQEEAEFFPVLGNHEFNSKHYYNNFDLPNNERWYSILREDILFVMLDSNTDLRQGSMQFTWVEDTLKSYEGKTQAILVFFHHPLFTSGKHSGDSKGFKDDLTPILEEYDVDIVFSGHNHSYERSYYNGIYFIVTGGGGAPLYGKHRDNEYSQKFIKDYHFCELYIEEGLLIMNVFDIHLNLIDNVSIQLD